jgi:LuxR family maltose regulon positive regulatory protein
MPSVLHGIRDFCGYAKEYEKAFKELGSSAVYQHMTYHTGALGIAEGEFLYERGKLAAAISALNRGYALARASGDMSLQFAAQVLLANIMMAGGQTERAEEILYHINRMLDPEEHSSLYDNYLAFRAQISLMKGQRERAARWLREEAPDENLNFSVLLEYQYLIKVRAYIQFGEYMQAHILLDMLEQYGKSYAKLYLRIQICVLKAILNYREEVGHWENSLGEAFRLAAPTGFVRVFAQEGGALYPLLEAYMKNGGREQDAYLGQMMKPVKNAMLLYPKYLSVDEKREALTAAETDVLRLLVTGKRNSEIASALFVSENTVKYHLKNIFLKLDAKNRSQAVKIALDTRIL